jgi:hypothetical protein
VNLSLTPRAVLRCVCCHDDLRGESWVCPGCGTTTHSDCRDELGRCPSLGCSTLRVALPRPRTRGSKRRWLRLWPVFVLVAFPTAWLVMLEVGHRRVPRLRDVSYGRCHELDGAFRHWVKYRTPDYRQLGLKRVAEWREADEAYRQARDAWNAPMNLSPGGEPDREHEAQDLANDQPCGDCLLRVCEELSGQIATLDYRDEHDDYAGRVHAQAVADLTRHLERLEAERRTVSGP